MFWSFGGQARTPPLTGRLCLQLYFLNSVPNFNCPFPGLRCELVPA